jgi:hypothetical protein
MTHAGIAGFGIEGDCALIVSCHASSASVHDPLVFATHDTAGVAPLGAEAKGPDVIDGYAKTVQVHITEFRAAGCVPCITGLRIKSCSLGIVDFDAVPLEENNPEIITRLPTASVTGHFEERPCLGIHSRIEKLLGLFLDVVNTRLARRWFRDLGGSRI